MDWLKDPKNQPKVAIGLAVVIVLAGVIIWFTMFKGPSDSGDTGGDVNMSSDAGDPMADGSSPVQQDFNAAPADNSQASSGTQQAAAQVTGSPLEAWRDDPFLPLDYKKPKGGNVKTVAPIIDFPFFQVEGRQRKDDPIENVPPLAQPSRRMAGLLLNDRIYAIIETNGKSEIVQPGDVLEDRLASVERIERDKIVLKTKDAKPRYIVIRMASVPGVTTSGDSQFNTVPQTTSGPQFRGDPMEAGMRGGDQD